MIDESWAAFVAVAEPAVFRRTAGLSWRDVRDGRCDQVMEPVPAMCEADGRTSLGALALLVDSAAGMAASTPRGGTVTLGLRVELARTTIGSQVEVQGRATAIGPVARLARGELFDTDGMFGHATLRAIDGVSWGRSATPETPHRPRDAATVQARSVDELIELTVEERRPDWVRAGATARAELGSGHRMLHGGAVALVAERVARGLLDGLAPVVLEIDYLRPVASDGARISATAATVNESRRFVHVAAEVLDDEGRRAATARVVGVRGG